MNQRLSRTILLRVLFSVIPSVKLVSHSKVTDMVVSNNCGTYSRVEPETYPRDEFWRLVSEFQRRARPLPPKQRGPTELTPVTSHEDLLTYAHHRLMDEWKEIKDSIPPCERTNNDFDDNYQVDPIDGRYFLHNVRV